MNTKNDSDIFAGGTTFELTANAQIWPRALNSMLGGSDDKIYLVVADMGSPSGQGLDFIGMSVPGVLSYPRLTGDLQTALHSCSASTAYSTLAAPRSASLPLLSLTLPPTKALRRHEGS